MALWRELWGAVPAQPACAKARQRTQVCVAAIRYILTLRSVSNICASRKDFTCTWLHLAPLPCLPSLCGLCCFHIICLRSDACAVARYHWVVAHAGPLCAAAGADDIGRQREAGRAAAQPEGLPAGCAQEQLHPWISVLSSMCQAAASASSLVWCGVGVFQHIHADSSSASSVASCSLACSRSAVKLALQQHWQ